MDGQILITSGYGVIDQAYAGPFSKIVAVGGSKNDVLDFSSVGVPVELIGGYGDDQLSGGSGADSINGSQGNDTLRGGAGHDQSSAEAARIRSSPDSAMILWMFAKGPQEPSFTLRGGDDTVLGSRFGDMLIATGNGHSRLEGGRGNDTLIGGAGMTRCSVGTVMIHRRLSGR